MRSLLMVLFCGVFAVSCVAAAALAQEASSPPEMRAAGKMMQDASGREFTALSALAKEQDTNQKLAAELKAAQDKLKDAEAKLATAKPNSDTAPAAPAGKEP
jgi:predicted  nucleic acid-binding Zn-ribbon protein